MVASFESQALVFPFATFNVPFPPRIYLNPQTAALGPALPFQAEGKQKEKQSKVYLPAK